MFHAGKELDSKRKEGADIFLSPSSVPFSFSTGQSHQLTIAALDFPFLFKL